MRYSFVPIIKTPSQKDVYQNIKYPEIPYNESDIYIYVTDTDRYDRLAITAYNDQNLWWIIPTANPTLPFNTLFPPTEQRIRIPANPNQAISLFEELNEVTIDLVYSNDIVTNKVGRSGVNLNISQNYTFESNALTLDDRLAYSNFTRYSDQDLNTLLLDNTPPTQQPTQQQQSVIPQNTGNTSTY